MNENPVMECDLTGPDLPVVRARLTDALHRADVREPARGGFVHAVLEAASNAVLHGGGSGRLTVRIADGELRGEVTDWGPGCTATMFAPGGAGSGDGGGHGLLVAELLTDRLEMHPGPDGKGTTVVLVMYLDDSSAADR